MQDSDFIPSSVPCTRDPILFILITVDANFDQLNKVVSAAVLHSKSITFSNKVGFKWSHRLSLPPFFFLLFPNVMWNSDSGKIWELLISWWISSIIFPAYSISFRIVNFSE